MATEMNDTAATVLGFLSIGPMSGWQLDDACASTVEHFWTITRSQIYRELRTLADLGLIEAIGSGQRNSTRYRITDAGRASFAEWLHQSSGAAPRVRDPFLIRVFFGRSLDADGLTDLVAVERARIRRRLRELERSDFHFNDFTDAAREYGIAHYRAVLAWLDATPWDKMTVPDPGGDSEAAAEPPVRSNELDNTEGSGVTG